MSVLRDQNMVPSTKDALKKCLINYFLCVLAQSENCLFQGVFFFKQSQLYYTRDYSPNNEGDRAVASRSHTGREAQEHQGQVRNSLLHHQRSKSNKRVQGNAKELSSIRKK